MDPNFAIEIYVPGINTNVTGLNTPTSMAFVENDLIILQKEGYVRLFNDGTLKKEPILEFEVFLNAETGLLGITTVDSTVYLYVTERSGEKVFGNRIYKYEWDGENLQNAVLVKELPYDPDLSGLGSRHSGGAMTTDLDGNVYAVIGDVSKRSLLQNLETGDYEDAGVVIHVNRDETVLKPSQTNNPTEHYYAMGIRNSFGLTIDPPNPEPKRISEKLSSGFKTRSLR